MADYVGGDMVRGHIDSIILNSLIDGDKDTNLIREEIEKRAAGKFQLKQGTFYSALQRIVKNGLVIEYRTTGSDGVRRKFFQLTEKGKAHIEKNQNNWTVSQEIINTLLDSEGPQVKFHRPSDYKPVKNAPEQEEKLPDFSASSDESEAQKVPKFGENIFESESEPELTFESSLPVLNEAEETTDESEALPDFTEEKSIEPEEETPTTFDDILNMLAKAEEERETAEQNSLKNAEETAENSKNEELALKELGDIVDGKSDENIAQNVAAAENKADEQAENTIKGTVLHVDFTKNNAEALDNAAQNAQPVVSEQNVSENAEINKNVQATAATTATETPVSQEKIEINRQEPEQAQLRMSDVSPSVYEPDDYLDSDDLPTQKEYREILNKIFASEPKSEEPKTEASEHVAEERPEPAVSAANNSAEENEDYGDVIVDELDFSPRANANVRQNQTDFTVNKRKNEENDEELDDIGRKTENIKKQVSPVGAYDYSDIIELSKREGFKVTTADKTNKNELGKILVNKLNFHTSLIFFALVFIETFIVYFALDGVVKFGIGSYLLFVAAVLVLPLVYGVIYFFAPKRAVGEISSFKSSFETALIITLNLFLLIIAFAIVTNLDFSSSREINAKIFIPVLIALNVPLFVVIRYSILENQTYFS